MRLGRALLWSVGPMLVPAAAVGVPQPPNPPRAEIDALYAVEHFQEVAAGLKSIRTYALEHPAGARLERPIAEEFGYRTTAGIRMLYTYQSWVEGGVAKNLHMLSVSRGGRPMPTTYARTLGAYLMKLLPIGSNPVSITFSERRTLFVVFLLPEEANKTYLTEPVRAPDAPMDTVIVECILLGKRLHIKGIP